jgi:hypothetical protein
MTNLDLEVRGNDITISLPGTRYAVTYYKPVDSPQLLAKRLAGDDDPRVAMSHAEFPCSGLAACQQQSKRARLDRLAAATQT